MESHTTKEAKMFAKMCYTNPPLLTYYYYCCSADILELQRTCLVFVNSLNKNVSTYYI